MRRYRHRPPPGASGVLVIENNAHLERGHFSVAFADLVEGLQEVGCRAEALTSRGWSKQADAPFPLYRYGPAARFIDRMGERAARSRFAAIQRAGAHLRVVAMIGATRAQCRRSGCAQPAVLTMSVATSPILVALLAGRGAWLVYQFTPPHASARREFLAQVLLRAAQRIERRRRRRGGAVRITTPNEACRAAW